MTPLRLTVAVPTYRRPQLLAKSLPLVLHQIHEVSGTGDPEVRPDVLVIDNDPEASARAIAEAWCEPSLRYVVEPTPGIAAARNRALDETRERDLLVFLDDDEQPGPGWLAALIATYCDTGATAVMGRVCTEYDHAITDPWIAAGDLFARTRMPTGTELSVAAAGNLLLDLRQLRAMGLRFDTRLGLCGGEDSLLSKQVVRRGGRIVFCDESVASDPIVSERLTRRWLLRRAVSQGSVTVDVDILFAEHLHERVIARCLGFARGAMRVAGGTARIAFGLLRRDLRDQARGARTTFRGAGMVRAAIGLRLAEYSRGSSRPRGSAIATVDRTE